MNDSHRTPTWLFDHFPNHFDPCPIGGTGGLDIPWSDPTYCNPPYSDPLPWIEKAIEESKKGVSIILLTRVDPSTKWWIKLVKAGFRCAFFHGRVRFTGKGTPNFAVCLWFSAGE
jgi:hypothetical protein